MTLHLADDPVRDSVDTLAPDSSGEGKRHQVMGNVVAPTCQPCCATCEDAKDSNSPWVPQQYLFPLFILGSPCLLVKAEHAGKGCPYHVGDTGERIKSEGGRFLRIRCGTLNPKI